ncbi:MAG: hypothetical protein PHC40_08055, partial [Eubacteriales bacterium]|nr:hypothetical protein [Eubacteriales bacterium]
MRKPKILSPSLCAVFFLLAFLLLAGTWTAIAVYGAEGTEEQTGSVYYGGSVVSEDAWIINQSPYISVEIAQKYGDFSKVSLDLTAKKINIDLSKQNLLMADDTTTAFVKINGGTVYIPLREINGSLYVPLDSTEQFLKLSTSIKNDSIYLYAYSGTDKIARVKSGDTIVQPSLTESDEEAFLLSAGQRVFLKASTPNYYMIETPEGKGGYTLKSNIVISDIDLAKVDFYAPKKDKFVRGKEKINLVWQYVADKTPAAPDTKKDGIDILAPTWFDQIVNGGGAVDNSGDFAYTKSAHQKGYLVWAT